LKITSKIALLIITVAVVIIIIGNWIFGISFKSYLIQQENEQIKTNVQNISSNLHATQMKYETLAKDWGYWDETYSFINNNNPEYVKLNLSNDSLSNIKTNLMVFYNKENSIIYKIYFDLEKSVLIPFPEGLVSEIEKVKNANQKDDKTSIIESEGKYYIISTSKTTDSLKEKPSNGMLIVGRLIDVSMVKELENIANGKIMFLSKDAIFNDAAKELSKSLSVENTDYSVIYNAKKDAMTIYIYPTNSDNSKSSVVVAVTKARDLYTDGMARLFFIQVVYSIFILIIILLLFWFLRIKVTKPIHKLSDDLNNIDITKNEFDMLPVTENMELSIISSAINNMFSRIEAQIAKNEQVEEMLRDSEERFRAIFEYASVGICNTSMEDRFLMANQKFCEIIGYSSEELMKIKFSDITHPDDRNISTEGSVKLLNGSIEHFYVEKRYLKKDNSIVWVNLTSMLMKDSEGQPNYFITTIRDVTDRKHAVDMLKESENRLIAAQSMAHVGNWELNLETKNIWASEEAFKIYGIEYISPYIPLDLIQKSVLPEYRKSLDNALIRLITKNKKYNEKFKIKSIKTGEERFVHSNAILLVDDGGKAIKVVGTVQDITDYKKAEEEILYLSHHDQLTGLYNRRYFDNAIKKLDDEKYVPLTLVLADVNGLKLTNDAFGHKAGDILLEKIANILKRECRTEDIVVRIGGDEFVLLLPETDAENADIIINRINAAIANEKIDNMILSLAMGFAVKKDISDDINEVYKKAEDEMYKYKLSESSSVKSKTIDLIMNTLYEKSNREMLHSKRVSEICAAIATKMNFDTDALSQIRIAGLMHDIGKIGIDEKILNKPQKLNSDEWNEIKRHSEIGYRILSSVNEFSKIAE